MKVCVIGAGNVGVNLALALYEKGVDIDTVYSRKLESALSLAAKVDARYTCTPEDVGTNCDVYFITVADSAIFSVIQEFPQLSKSLLVHTSGTVGLDEMTSHSTRCGVLYPLQTFSKEKIMEFSSIPCFIEAGTAEDLKIVKKTAQKVSNTVREMSSESRKILHIAAVFSCNFTNHLVHVASEILGDEGLDFSMLKPLIAETASKASKLGPSQAQTGPAIREDKETVQLHLDYLKSTPHWRELYRLITEDIIRNKHGKRRDQEKF